MEIKGKMGGENGLKDLDKYCSSKNFGCTLKGGLGP